MKPYESYSAADFIQDDDFRDWLRGRSNREAFWLAFPHRYPRKEEAFRQAEQFIRAATVTPEPISEGEIRREAALFIEKASPYTAPRYPSLTHSERQKGTFQLPSVIRWGMAVAALLVGVVSVGWYVSLKIDRPVPIASHRPDGSTAQLVETTNPTGQPLRVVLQDGSEVRLTHAPEYLTKRLTIHAENQAALT